MINPKDFGKIRKLEVSLVFPKKMSLKEILKTFNNWHAYAVTNKGEIIPIKLRGKWINKRHGELEINPVPPKGRKIKETYLKYE